MLVFFFLFFLTTTLATIPDPDPETIQTQTQTQTQTLHPTPPATIPAFPEQSATAGCPLDLPDDLFHGIKSACGSKPHHLPDPSTQAGQLHRSRCCPVLAAWLYSAYSKTALSATAKAKPQTTASYDMPVLPDDSETCVDGLEKALGNRGVQLSGPNETCDFVYCYCGIRLHPFSCPEAFGVDARGEVVGGESVRRLERDCFNGGFGGCSKCLNTLYSLNGEKIGRSNKTERTSKMHNRDCELMGLTWLLNKDRSSYIHTVSAVLRALMIDAEDTSDPTFCSLNSDGMPLAVDSSEINDQSSSYLLTTCLHHYLLPFSLLFVTLLFFFNIRN